MSNRRSFIKTTSAALAVGALSRNAWAQGAWRGAGNGVHGNLSGTASTPGSFYHADDLVAISGRDPRVKALAHKALEAAQRSGATYADVRITLHLKRRVEAGNSSDNMEHGVGVRALRDGYWGFASTPFLSEDEVVRAGREAAELAVGNATAGGPRTVEWAPVPVVRHGDWTTPVAIDPLGVNVQELINWKDAVTADMSDWVRARYPMFDPNSFIMGLHLTRTDAVFVSTEGSDLVQTFYRTAPGFQLVYPWHERDRTSVMARAMYISTDQVFTTLFPTSGWEVALALTPKFEEIIDRTVQQAERELALPVKHVEIGRKDVVYDWATMGYLLNATLGAATELDRAMGYEANAGGTSYLGPNPMDFLPSPVAAPVVTVRADRSTPGAAGTAKWDMEGVATQPFTLVDGGKLVDYQTTRESAGWLSEYYKKTGRAVTSNGCAGAAEVQALEIPLQHRPNLTMAAGRDDTCLEALMSNVKSGLLIRDGSWVQMDRQVLNGFCAGNTYEIQNGRIVARIRSAGFLFRSPELWKNITAIGGAASARWSLATNRKGEPLQTAEAHVSAVPAQIKDITIIDMTRRG